MIDNGGDCQQRPEKIKAKRWTRREWIHSMKFHRMNIRKLKG
jgi:hypothetical protein